MRHLLFQALLMQRNLKLAGVLSTFALFGLTACGQPRIEIVRPPVSLTTCDDEPVPPSLPDRDQQIERDRLILSYILGLRSAWGDCKAKVEGVRAWADGLE